jgi:hypothetical protein
MSTKGFNLARILFIGVSILILIGSQLVMAEGNNNGSGKGHGKNKNIGVGNASDGIKGRVIIEKGIYYTGDPLEISLRFQRGSEHVAAGDMDAYVVIFAPDTEETDGTESDPDTDTTDDQDSDSGTDAAADSDSPALTDAIVLPVNNEASEELTKLFELGAVDVGTLAAGTYQLGLILTNPGGDPLNINDWYNGLLGLEHVVGLTITDEAVDFDSDGDGHVDDDADGDGFSDDDDDDTDDTDDDSDGSS